MREYIWYSPEIDVYIVQTILEGCIISFEWDWSDCYKYLGLNIDVDDFLWIPIGEL